MNARAPTVVNGELQHVSVSSIKLFDDTTSTGCNRRFYFSKVLHRPDPPTGNQAKGVEIHSQIEHYLLTGEDVLGPAAREAKRFLPEPKAKGLGIEVPLKDIGLTIAGVPVLGFVDVVNDTGVWFDNEGTCHTLQEDEIEIADHKTTSNLAYAKTPKDLTKDVQMVGYGKAATLIKPAVRGVRLSHNYISTKKREAKKISVLMSVQEIEDRFHGHLVPTVEKMKQSVRLKVVEDLRPNLEACHSFNRPCPFLEECQKDPLTQLLAFSDLLTDDKNPATKNQEDNKMSLLDKLSGAVVKPAVFPDVTAYPSPPAEVSGPAWEDEPSIGIQAPEKAPNDPVLAKAGEDGQVHKSSDGQLYVWKDGRWGFAGAETKRIHDALTGGKDIEFDMPKVEEPKKRGRPPKNPSPSVPPEEVATKEAPKEATKEAPKEVTAGPQSVMLFAHCIPSIPSSPLEPYIQSICNDLVNAANISTPKPVTYSILGSKNELLAFGAWKGTLRNAIHVRPPQPGAYHLLAQGELYDIAAEAVGELCTLFVRGVK